VDCQQTSITRELANLREQSEAHRIAALGHQSAIDELKRAKARAEDELRVVCSDLDRARKDYESAMLRLTGLRKSTGQN